MAADDGVCTMPFRRDLAVLILETDANLQRNISEALRGRYPNLVTVPDCEAALDALRSRPADLLVAEVSDAAAGGIPLLRRMAAADGCLMAVAIAETGDTVNALEAIKLGAFQCLSRPLDTRSLLTAIDGAADEVVKRQANLGTRRRISFAYQGKRLIGNGRAMQEVFQRIQMVRKVNTNVVIRGETGTGKELVAYAIHKSGPRAQAPFVKLNCGAIPKDLLESELFGHEKGAFTGALSQHVGRFEAANGGTILLDEIGDMPLELQVKLLSVLQDRELQRVGGHERIGVDVRVIAATHQDLEEAIGLRQFREDLYYRLHVVRIDVPPLRERKEDIPLLVQYFLDRHCTSTGKHVAGVDPEAMGLLMSYDYPGNVRELENFIEAAVVLCEDDVIGPDDLPPAVRKPVEKPVREGLVVTAGMPLEEVERLCIIETLKHTEGNKRRAAALLGISEKSVYNKLGRYKIPSEQAEGEEEAYG
jgi:DNA-binding NtrC family response regulator